MDMATFGVQFSAPIELPSTFDGRYFRVPYTVVEREHFDTPRQSVHTAHSCVNVKVSGSALAVLHLDDSALAKVVYQIAKEHLQQLAGSGGSLAKESTVSYNSSGADQFDIAKIEVPEGALMVVDVHHPIGFISGG